MDDATFDAVAACARRAGQQAGAAARAAGDAEPCDLSGKWAGDPTDITVTAHALRAAGVRLSVEHLDGEDLTEIADAYEAAYNEAVQA